MRKQGIVLLAVIWCVASGAVLAQSTGSLSGTVVDQDGNPVGGLTLKLTPADGSANMPQKIKINKKGKFAHHFLPTAKYRVELKGSDAFLKSMKYELRGGSNELIDTIESGAHPEKGLPPISVLAGQRSNLALVVAGESQRKKLVQAAAMIDASSELKKISEMLNSGKLDRTVEETSTLLEKRPDFGAALFLRGSALHRQGKIEQAEADLRKAVELLPEQPGVHAALADVMLLRADALYKDEATKEAAAAVFSEAADVYAVELERSPDAEQLIRNQSVALELANRPEETRAALTRLIEVAPADRDAFFRLAALDAAGQNYEAAVVTLVSMPSPDRETATVMFNLAVDLFNDEDYDASLPIVDRALEIDPSLAELYRLRAGILLVQGQREGAIGGLERYLELAAPDAPDVPQSRQLLEALRASSG